MNRIVAFLVAFLVVAVVAIPIINSISDGQSGSGDSGPITYTNTGDYYYKPTADDDAVHTVHLSYVWETLTETTSRDTYTLTLDDSVIFSYTRVWDEDNYTPLMQTIIPVGWGQEGLFGVSPFESAEYAFMAYPGDSFTPNLNLDYIDSDDSGSEECSFTIQNGVISYTEYGTGTVITSEYHMDYFITTDTSGEYVLTDTPFKMDDNSLGLICECNMVEDDEHETWWDAPVYGRFTSDSLESPSTEIELDSSNSTVSSETTIFSSNDNGLITVSKIESEISVTPIGQSYTVTDTVSLKAIVPTTVTVEGESGGSDSDSGAGSGMTSTILKLVPILLILGLFVAFIVPMIQNRTE